ncbi:MAG: Modification methylase MboII [candidate division TA06 bacterium ADurb.Bin417]|uniref:Modification methylase MboII n=1 Tax=candidate division TA06 bacterium ADurb.Bin417 TaxID=1852828 RepID=A0A1V5ML90_UNCT6|nr:MAG: Modification methylase MboII [candidate division TA06 bacterium ADurb.Bin417]
MRKLSDQEIERILTLLREGKPLPESYKADLFETRKEYELTYAEKSREEDILSDTLAVPLQKFKTFRNGGHSNDWTNTLIFGDNLQVLKTLLEMKKNGELKNADGTPGVRLVYIDPPFATRQEFRGSQDQKAYQDKIVGARFLEFLRKRLVFLRELLSEDGSIYVHLDEKKGHYIKTLLDEVFGEQYFQREIVWDTRVLSGFKTQAENWIRGHDVLLFYSKTNNFIFNKLTVEHRQEYIDRFNKVDKEGRKYFDGRGGRRYLDEVMEKGKAIGDVWDDIMSFQQIPTSTEKMGYPTQKPEALLNRIIKASSNPGDLVLDCFAGSGTTLAVTEKLGRRWIGVDCGKLAIYTMQKRLLNIADSKDLENPKKKYGKPCKPFTIYNAGLYDYGMIKALPWEQYREFALKLFQCRNEKHEISKIELDGYLGADSVMVFNYQKHQDAVLDRNFIDDLHKYLGDRIGVRFFIIAPAASVQFLEDYIEKGRTRYFILRIPYSIIEEIHNRGFIKIKQPVSETDVNDTVDAVGFDFIQTPQVECQYFTDDKKGQLELGKGGRECVIEIERFESRIISRKPLDFKNLETLSMVMLDYDFNGEVFDLDEVFYAENLKKDSYKVRFAKGKIKSKIMIIYVDIFGNEKREVKVISDFKNKARE